MDTGRLRAICLSLPGVTETVQWGDNRVFKVGGRMFAVSGIGVDARFSFKVDDDRFLELTGLPGVVPAPYLARARWVQIVPAECALSDTELTALVRRGHAIIASRLPRRVRRELRLP